MKKLFIALLSFALSHVTWAQLVHFQGILDGPQSGTPSTGTGWLSGTINTATNWFVLDYAFSGLSAPQTAAHVHHGAHGVNGPVVIGAPTFPLGSPIHWESMISDEVEMHLLAGDLYLNIHTTAFRAGEIRGQLVPVPEPSTYAAAGAAMLAGLIVLRRRRAAAATTAAPRV